MVKTPVRALLVLGTALWCLAIVSAPLFDLPAVYLFFSRLCHQLPGRSWHIHGEQLAVCIRCTSIYLGFLAGLVLLEKPRVLWFEAAITMNIAQWIFSIFISDAELLRVLVGGLLGATTAPIICSGLEEMFIKRVRTVNASM